MAPPFQQEGTLAAHVLTGSADAGLRHVLDDVRPRPQVFLLAHGQDPSSLVAAQPTGAVPERCQAAVAADE